LSLAGEQRIVLTGLPAPAPTLTNSSYQLFMAHARQVAPQGQLEPAANDHQADHHPTSHRQTSSHINSNTNSNSNTEDEVSRLLPALKRIHEIVAGMPLGLELAAAWCETYDVPTIADKLNHDALLLESSD